MEILYTKAGLFLFLFLSHCITDFALQTTFIATYKKNIPYVMLIHVFMWSMPIIILINIFGNITIWKILMLFIGHYVIDLWKCREWYKMDHLYAFYTDQFLHIAQLGLCII
jgi:Protein of unknown function (DUF3307).